jgi:prepilin-type processing-associated H-X9-DG protein
MYAADSDDYVANNYTVPGTIATINNWSTNGVADCWAPNMMTFSITQDYSNSSTNVALAKAGQLSKYLQSISAYHCPADTYISPAQRAVGWKNRIRSISMNSNWGRNDPNEPPEGIPTSWGYGAKFRQWHRVSGIRKPSQGFVFVDEQSGSINDGFFIVTFGASQTGEYPGTYRNASWGDVPGFYHRNSTPFGFADGHTEMRTWFSRNIPVGTNGDFNTGVADLRDQQWYVQHVAERL